MRHSKQLANIFAVTTVLVYLGLFFLTGFLLASLTGLPWLPLTGLIFLVRLCLT